MPSGGTSDYAPEMIHAAAQGEAYQCFVRPDTRIPFMAMPDGVEALLKLAAAPRERLSRTAYNVRAFNPSAEEIREMVLRAFPDADITYQIDVKRQGIVDSWPADVDDSAARRDWGFAPEYDFERAFREYLIPNIRERYAAGTPRTPERPPLAGESPLFTGTAVRRLGAAAYRVQVDARGDTTMESTAGSRDQVGPLRQFGRLLFGGLMGVGALTTLVALLLMWLFLTEPVDMAITIRSGNSGDVARLVVSAVYDLVARLVAWL